MEGVKAGKVTSIISIQGLMVQPCLPIIKIVFYSTVYNQNSLLLRMATEAKKVLPISKTPAVKKMAVWSLDIAVRVCQDTKSQDNVFSKFRNDKQNILTGIS